MTVGDALRVLVVEDSLTIRRHIVEVLSSAPGIVVIGEAADGRAAIELCMQLRPDVVTMDMMLPVMTGLAATEYIMAHRPTPILIVSASTNRGELFKTYDALAAGAVDVLEKPLGIDVDEGWERELVLAVRRVSRIRVITHPRARLGRFGRPLANEVTPSPVGLPALEPAPSPTARSSDRRLVALGASTGGPGALLTVLQSLPPGFPLPVLVVLHIAEPFALAIAEWLDAQLETSVRHVRDREPLPPIGRGGVLLAPADRHLELQGGLLRLSAGPERHSCRPSVDVLFESLAREAAPHTIAALLTGMGKDGASGLLAIQRGGGLTIAQDEATSVVFGMPGEAVRLGAATRVLPLDRIGPALVRAAEHDLRPGGRP